MGQSVYDQGDGTKLVIAGLFCLALAANAVVEGGKFFQQREFMRQQEKLLKQQEEIKKEQKRAADREERVLQKYGVIPLSFVKEEAVTLDPVTYVFEKFQNNDLVMISSSTNCDENERVLGSLVPTLVERKMPLYVEFEKEKYQSLLDTFYKGNYTKVNNRDNATGSALETKVDYDPSHFKKAAKGVRVICYDSETLQGDNLAPEKRDEGLANNLAGLYTTYGPGLVFGSLNSEREGEKQKNMKRIVQERGPSMTTILLCEDSRRLPSVYCADTADFEAGMSITYTRGSNPKKTFTINSINNTFDGFLNVKISTGN